MLVILSDCDVNLPLIVTFASHMSDRTMVVIFSLSYCFAELQLIINQEPTTGTLNVLSVCLKCRCNVKIKLYPVVAVSLRLGSKWSWRQIVVL